MTSSNDESLLSSFEQGASCGLAMLGKGVILLRFDELDGEVECVSILWTLGRCGEFFFQVSSTVRGHAHYSGAILDTFLQQCTVLLR